MRSEAGGAPKSTDLLRFSHSPAQQQGRARLPCPSAVLGGMLGDRWTLGCAGCRGWHMVARGWHMVARGLPPAPRAAQAALPPRAACRAHTSHAAHACPPTPVPPRQPAPHALPTRSLTPRPSKSCSPSLEEPCPSAQSSDQPRELCCSPRSPRIAQCP